MIGSRSMNASVAIPSCRRPGLPIALLVGRRRLLRMCALMISAQELIDS